MIKDKKNFKILLVYPNLPLMLVPPLSMAIFTKLLKTKGYNVDLFDTTSYIPEEANSSPQNRTLYLQARDFNDEDDLGVAIKTDLYGDFRKKVFKFEPDLIIFSIVEDAFIKALKMMDNIADYDCVKISGGVLPTADPEYVLNTKQINFIAIGEGEITLSDVAEVVRKKGDLKTIKGTWFKENDGKISKNPRNKLVDINESLPDYSLFDPRRFFRPMGGKIFKTIPVETYRGCPYKCTFCNSPMHNTQVKNENIAHDFLRRKTIENVRKELLDLKRLYGPEFIYFVDDSFLARPKKEIFEFCEMYEEFKIPFWFNTRPENCKVDYLNALKKVGAYRISFGIECGNPDFRQKVLLRKPSNQEIIDSFKVIHASGIAFSANLIIGFPGETRELVMETIELVKQIKGYDTITVSIFTPYRGTELQRVAVKNGWLDKDHITIHTTSSSVLKMPEPYLSSKDIDGLMKTIPLYVYFPKSEWGNIRKAEENDDEGKQLYDHYSSLYKKNFLKGTQEDKKILLDESLDKQPIRAKQPKIFNESIKEDYKGFKNVKLSNSEIAMLTMDN
jgi:radical SAM superfamily enzyme YgiQ (UPF0313 family)